jgi:hypothetical protein
MARCMGSSGASSKGSGAPHFPPEDLADVEDASKEPTRRPER